MTSLDWVSKVQNDLKALVSGSFLPRWLRFVWLRVPDAMFGLLLYNLCELGSDLDS